MQFNKPVLQAYKAPHPSIKITFGNIKFLLLLSSFIVAQVEKPVLHCRTYKPPNTKKAGINRLLNININF